MTRLQIEAIVSPHESAILNQCAQHNAPVRRIAYDGALNKGQRKDGNIGRIHILLADEAPGWRAKDNPEGRAALKAAVKQLLAQHGIRVAVTLAANYSELVSIDGMVHRRDASGRSIGAYRQF